MQHCEIFRTILLLKGLVLLAFSTITLATNNQVAFSAKLFDTITREQPNTNIVISPASIRTCLALTYMGAVGNAAEEMRVGLNLGKVGLSKDEVAVEFQNLINKMKGSSANATIKMANRIYFDRTYQLYPKFNELARKYFYSDAKSIYFKHKAKAAYKINSWIKDQTEKRIQNVISSADLDDDTIIVLVNVIYFKMQFVNFFDKSETQNRTFHLSAKESKQIPIMHQINEFSYADLKDLNAKALSMKYRYTDTNIQLLVLLPMAIGGLSELEQKLKNIDLTKILGKLEEQTVGVFFPKFKMEFQISLESTLEKLGIHKIFTNDSDLTELAANALLDVRVTKVMHKAFIEFKEDGTEAAAATAVGVGGYGMGGSDPHYEIFNVNQPFFFALLDDEVVYFNGHALDIEANDI